MPSLVCEAQASLNIFVAEADLELLISLPLSPECWYYRHAPPCLAHTFLELTFWAAGVSPSECMAHLNPAFLGVYLSSLHSLSPYQVSPKAVQVVALYPMGRCPQSLAHTFLIDINKLFSSMYMACSSYSSLPECVLSAFVPKAYFMETLLPLAFL